MDAVVEPRLALAPQGVVPEHDRADDRRSDRACVATRASPRCSPGVLAGLGVAALIAASRVYLWERELHGRLLAERKRGGRIFLRAG